MQWNRGVRPTQPIAPGSGQPVGSPISGRREKLSGFGGQKLAATLLLFCVSVVVIGLFVLSFRGGSKLNPESDFVDSSKMQAVFLNGGQVYFGHISHLNSQYLRVKDIYYLRVNQTVQPNQQNTANQQATQNDISLVKLGCELHGPEDSMVINREQIIFWENLKGDGQVAKAVEKYVQENPGGQKCDTSTQTNTNQTTTPTTTTPAPSTGTRR